MRREEDFQRTQVAVNVPLISVSQEFSTFKKTEFPNERICLERKKPFTEFYYNKTYPEYRQNFDWSYLDKVSKPVVSVHEFRENWDIFTMKQLALLNWNNVLAAGGTCYTFLQVVILTRICICVY